MRSRYRVLAPDNAHFVTSTIVEWLPVFTTAARCDILTASLDYCRRHKGLLIYGWVILDNHFHAIVAASDLPRVLADLKRHTAQRILEQLEAEGCDWLLNAFRYHRTAHKRANEHQVWQEGAHPQAIVGDEMMLRGRRGGFAVRCVAVARGGISGSLRSQEAAVQLPGLGHSQVQLGNEKTCGATRVLLFLLFLSS